jgi:hypothetical protein
VEIFASARKHGIDDLDIVHATEHALAIGEQERRQGPLLGPDRAGNLLEVISVLKDDETEIVIHAMPMRRAYESFLRDMGDADD